MRELALSIGEPFTSPGWGSNFVFFSGDPGKVISEADAREYLRRACKYAHHYEVYLIPERFVLMGYQCMCLISPEGKVVGAQRATHLCHPAPPDAKRGDSIDVISTEFGGIFLCVDVDVYHPEVVRIAAQTGAQFLFCAQQIKSEDYANHMVVTGLWGAAQSGVLFSVGVSNQFHAVCAPLPLTPMEDGFLANPTQKTPFLIKMRADDLEHCQRRRPLSRKLYAVHRNELVDWIT